MIKKHQSICGVMQVWKKRGWRLGAADGVFVQLEARGPSTLSS